MPGWTPGRWSRYPWRLRRTPRIGVVYIATKTPTCTPSHSRKAQQIEVNTTSRGDTYRRHTPRAIAEARVDIPSHACCREWAGARELVDSSYQPTYVVLEGHNPIPSALSCTFLPANRQATSIFKGNGRTTRIPVPLHPPWATTRFGIEYVGISRRAPASIFARLRRRDPGSNLGPPVRRRTP